VVGIFHIIENKTYFIKMAANFFKSEDGKKQLSVPLIFTAKDETWRITKDEEAKCRSSSVTMKRQILA
jgi:hypothetical protein